MVDWFELGRSIIVDSAKLLLFWFAERGRSKCSDSAAFSVEFSELGSRCLEHFTQRLACEKEKAVSEAALNLCEDKSCFWTGSVCWVLGFLATVLLWGLVHCHRRVPAIVVGNPISIETVVREKSLDRCDPFDDFEEDGEVVAARRRARTLRG